MFFRVTMAYTWLRTVSRREEKVFLRLVILVVGIHSIGLLKIAGAQDDGPSEIVTRIWTDKENRQVSATFKALIGGTVKVEKYNGEMSSFPYDALMSDDQKYVDAVVRKFGSAPGARTWSDTSGNNFRGSFVQISKSEVEFLLLDEEKRMKIEAVFMTEQDISFILDELNKSIPTRRINLRYRNWAYKDANGNELRAIGRYKSVNGSNLVLTQMEGTHLIPLSRLASQDLDYVATVDPSSKGLLAEYQGASVSRSDDVDSKKKKTAINADVKPIWWISLGLVFLLMLVLISIKYVYESADREYDDEF